MQTLVCQSFPAWDTPYVKSTVEILKRVSKTKRVIFLDYPYTLKDLWSHPNVPKKAIWSRKPRLIQTGFGEIEVYNFLPVLPVNWVNSPILFRFLMWINGIIQGWTIRRIRKQLDPKETQVINAFNPVNGHFTKTFWKGFKQNYYAYDQLEATAWAGKWGKHFEPEFIRSVNQIIVSSSGLRRKFEKLHPNVKCVKNGVSLEHFQHPPMEKPQTKKMGYLGAFDDRVDLELIKQVAEAYPDYLIEILGPVKISRESFPENVIFLGAKDPSELNTTVQDWCLCLIPFVKNEFTQAIYPLKINEYLAAGKPVVSTDFADLSDFEGMVRVVESHADFINGIKKEIRYNNRLKISKRISFAKQNSWESRAEEFLLALAS